MIASVQELIAQERGASSPDEQIARVLSVSRLPPPEGFHHWSKIAVRAAMGEDPSGFTPDGRPGTGVQ